ncbi:alpha/beta hydrolase [Bradyrhizobium sp. HKCCYLS3077]|uniref:alpha/beta hydrolase n=1 Tax=Bradyrhizobium sp. HKCCYLS3077 TaxID=3420761 RepID=UPI003EC04255
MSKEFILIAGPMVRASSWQPTAEHLRKLGYSLQVPDILAHHATPPAWSAWPRLLLDHIAPTDASILVGHSSASALVASLATKLPVRGIIIVDGDIPPDGGRAWPVRPALHEFVRRIAAADGILPIWSRWFVQDPQRATLIGLDQLSQNPIALAQFEDGLPAMTLSWFEEDMDLMPWRHIPVGYLQTSPIYEHASAEALRLRWPVEKLNGTHLHPTLCPAETASALIAIARQLEPNASRTQPKAPSRKTNPDTDRR